jgi:hypothetical protein
MATVLFVAASVMTGFDTLLPVGLISLTWLVADCPHAASTAIAAQPRAERTRREFMTKRSAS